MPYPVILFIINNSSKISFYHTILLFGLAIGLKVEDSKEPLFDTQKVVQKWLELGHEYWATVNNNRVMQTMVLNYNIEDNFC